MAKQARSRVFEVVSQQWIWTGWFNVEDSVTEKDFPYGVEFRDKPKLRRVVKIDENDGVSYIDIDRVKEFLDYWVEDEALSFVLSFEMDSDG